METFSKNANEANENIKRDKRARGPQANEFSSNHTTKKEDMNSHTSLREAKEIIDSKITPPK